AGDAAQPVVRSAPDGGPARGARRRGAGRHGGRAARRRRAGRGGARLTARTEQSYSDLIVRSIGPVWESDLTTKARIREAAMRRFALEGVAATSLRSVARAAGVTPGLVVHHFGSKDGLVRAVDAAVVERIEASLCEVPLEDSGPELVARRAEQVGALLRNQ